MKRRGHLTRPAWRVRPSSMGCGLGTRAVMSMEDGTLSVRERVDVVLRDDAVFAAASVIPPKREGTVGRRRTYPDQVWTMWPELRAIFGSHTAVERELGRGNWWAYIRRELRRLRPELPALPAKSPRRQDYEYMRERYLATEEGIRLATELHTKLATEQAKEAGNLDPDGGGSFTHPEITPCPRSTGAGRSMYGSTRMPMTIADTSTAPRISVLSRRARRTSPASMSFAPTPSRSTGGGGFSLHQPRLRERLAASDGRPPRLRQAHERHHSRPMPSQAEVERCGLASPKTRATTPPDPPWAAHPGTLWIGLDHRLSGFR